MSDRCKPKIIHIYDGQAVRSFGGTKSSWQEIPQGAIITEAGSGQNYHTGDWRTERAVWIEENCIQCLRCWVSCPDVAWPTKEGKVSGVDYRYCKGCGICNRICPADAIFMMDEEEAIEKFKKNSVSPKEITPDLWPHMNKDKKTD